MTRSVSGRFTLRAWLRASAVSSQCTLPKAAASGVFRCEPIPSVSRSRRSSEEISFTQPGAISNRTVATAGRRIQNLFFEWDLKVDFRKFLAVRAASVNARPLGECGGHSRREDPHPRFWQSIHAAHRAPRAGVGGVLRDPPAGPAGGRHPPLRPARNHPVRRAGLGGGGGIAAVRSVRLRRRGARAGHLLRAPTALQVAWWPGGSLRASRIRHREGEEANTTQPPLPPHHNHY